MNEPKQLIAAIAAPDAEVELSAQDLLELSSPCDNNGRKSAPMKRAKETLPRTGNTTTVPGVSARRQVSASRVSLSLVVAIGAISALYLAMAPSDDAGQPPMANKAAQSQWPEPTKVEGGPVLFANPFDANEVFEFPEGTSEAEARDAVAEILMERAMERQRHLDARVSSNR